MTTVCAFTAHILDSATVVLPDPRFAALANLLAVLRFVLAPPTSPRRQGASVRHRPAAEGHCR